MSDSDSETGLDRHEDTLDNPGGTPDPARGDEAPFGLPQGLSGTYRIEPTEETTPRERITVAVAHDSMSAEVTLLPPEDGEAPLTEEEVLGRLAAAGVVFGIDPEAVRSAVAAANRGEVPGFPVTVARGQPPVPGEDGTITYDPCLTTATGRPRMMPDGTVDMFDLNTVRNVAKDTVLATVTLPTEGANGMTVRGATIRTRPGVRASFTAGKGTAFDPATLTVRAALDGHAGLVWREITVTPVYLVKGDLGLATGNIDFVGSVKVLGNVTSGYSVKTQGDLEVMGNVEGAQVIASGNVTVHGGIVGGKRGTRLKVKGFVKARFIEGAEINAGGSVWAADGIVQSRIESGDVVEVLGRRGCIVGGSILARKQVRARTLGSPLGSPTAIAVGVPSELRAQMAELSMTIKQLTKQMDETNQLVQTAADAIRRGEQSALLRNRLTQAAAQRDGIMEALQQARERQEELAEAIRRGVGASIQASERCYPGVSVTVDGAHHHVSIEQSACRFIQDGNMQIAVVPPIR